VGGVHIDAYRRLGNEGGLESRGGDVRRGGCRVAPKASVAWTAAVWDDGGALTASAAISDGEGRCIGGDSKRGGGGQAKGERLAGRASAGTVAKEGKVAKVGREVVCGSSRGEPV
jgi:hypothetical protein